MCRIFIEAHSKCGSINRKIGCLLHNDSWASKLKMSICSTKPLGKDYLSNANGTSANEALTYVPVTMSANLEVENNLKNK